MRRYIPPCTVAVIARLDLPSPKQSYGFAQADRAIQ